ncbi:transposase, partial [Legionella pneumophila]
SRGINFQSAKGISLYSATTAICWMLRTGTAWRDLPLDYGNRKSVYNRYNNWSKKGYITAILTELKKRWRSRMAHA